uniref:Uncharacterized protein n=1 Tax=Panagrolaimus sp. ES5 TaxID=591445 RepID=A0AC34G8I9_9BILA
MYTLINNRPPPRQRQPLRRSGRLAAASRDDDGSDDEEQQQRRRNIQRAHQIDVDVEIHYWGIGGDLQGINFPVDAIEGTEF